METTESISMPNNFENGLFIFRRDLRIVDNNGLNLLNKHCKNIYTIFIFTPQQVSSSNKYRSTNAIQFMIESLEDLASNIKRENGELHTFYGNDKSIIENIIKKLNINIVCFNLDYSPFAIERDKNIINLCEKMKVHVMYDYDYYLNPPDTIVNASGTPYQKFTPYYTTAIKKHVNNPTSKHKIHFKASSAHIDNSISLKSAFSKMIGTKENTNVLIHGGRNEAIQNLSKAVKSQSHYSKTRDDISKNTSLMSAYIKFGCISIREVYKVFKNNKPFIRQLYWRDFYAQILYHFPHVLGHAMKRNYDKIRWHHNDKWFNAWCTGNTGFPLIDASMRQLNTIGWCHNRGRMNVSSFLTKILLIDWRKGEKYYAQQLIDYDPANNNGGWQWSSGTGADSQPYFRIFNPWLQSKEHDSDCEYIKRWIPELKDVPNDAIHNWYKEYQNHKDIKYPKPICDYDEQKKKALQMYKSI